MIPVAGLSGENLLSKSAEMPWYAGHTAIESLDALGSMNRPAETRLRTCVIMAYYGTLLYFRGAVWMQLRRSH